MNDAGRIGFVPKGDYNASTTYEFLDVVHYGHNSYVAKGTTTGNLPTNTTYWQPITDGEFLTATDYATASVAGIVKPDGSTTEVGSNGVFSAKGVTITATVNPSGTAYSANWLMVNGSVITPEADKLYKVTVSGSTGLYYWDGTQYALTSAGSSAGVSSFKGRTGAVVPASGDYTPDQAGAVGLISTIEIDGSASLPYDFDYYDGSKPGNYFRVQGSAMAHSPTGMSTLPFKMTVEQIQDMTEVNIQCKQTVIFCNSRDDDTEAYEFFRYGKIVITWQDQDHLVGTGNLEFTDWKEAGEGGGHVIVNSSGTDMAQRSKLKFANATVTDDSQNDQSIITVPSMTGAAAGSAGAAGLVPAPSAGDQGKVLAGSGLWVPQTSLGAVSDEYSTAKAYAVGDYCIYGNKLYKCIQAKAAGVDATPPNATYWTDKNSDNSNLTIATELVSLNSGLINITEFNDLSSFTTYTGSRISDRSPSDMVVKYKQKGNIVYLYIDFSYIPSSFRQYTQWDQWSILWGSSVNTLPIPQIPTQLYCVDQSGAFCSADIEWVGTVSDKQASKVLILGNPSLCDLHDGEKAYIYGWYST